jgi:hypothetical protein
MGSVYISDETGHVLWEGENTLTNVFQRRLLLGLSRPLPGPQYCAVGQEYGVLVDEPWRRVALEKEIHRLRVNGTFVDPLSHRAHVVTAFRSQNANTTWRELALFTRVENAHYGDRSVTSCDGLNANTPAKKWTTWPGNTLIADPAVRTEGLAALVCTGDATPTIFANTGVGIRSVVGTAGIDLTMSARLQFYLGISNPAGLTSGLFVFAYPGISLTDYFRWDLSASDLSAGINAIDLQFNAATRVGSPTEKPLCFTLALVTLSRASGMWFTLDRIRVFEEHGTMLARTEIHPAIHKPAGTTRIVTWVIEPFNSIEVLTL